MCDESSSVQHVQPKVILQSPDFQQHCRGRFVSTKHLVWTFLRSSLQAVPKLFSATWCVGARCTNCVFLLWTQLLRLAKCVAERWIQYFGPPLVIIADQGKEFVGTQFKEFTNANSILLHIIDVRAPWQNGRTERHGDIYKKVFERARWLHSPSSSVALQRLAMECNAAKNQLSNRSGYSPLQRVFGIGHRFLADLTSDDMYGPDPIYDLAATDASFEESRQIREAAMKAHAEVSIRDRIEDSVRARPRTQTVLRADDVIMVWKTNPPSKRGRWVGPGVCIGTHRGSVWVNMRGSLWKCSQLQCKLATTEESRGLEIQNQLLDDMKAEFQEFPGRRVYTVEREGIPPSDVDKQPVAPRGVPEEEDRNSALVPMSSQMTSPLPSSLTLRVTTVFEKRYKVNTCKFRLMFPVVWTVIAVIEPCLKISEIRVGPCRLMSCHVKWKKMCKMCEFSILTIL